MSHSDAVRMALVLVVLLVLLVAPVHADEPSNDACLACHGNAAFTDDDGRSLAVDGARFDDAPHGILACTTCHADAAAPHATTPNPVPLDTCATCHDGAVSAYGGGVHGAARAAGIAEAPRCADCHGDLHTVRPHTEPDSAVHWSRLAGTCARCHADLRITEKFRIPVVRPVEAYLQSTHARLVAAGKRAAVCSDCHRPHDVLSASDPRSSVWRTNVPETCGACHADVLAAYRGSVHGEALARGVRQAPVCTDCHGEHRILGAREPTSPVFAANIALETCGRCHADARLSEKYGLRAGAVAAFQDSYHGLALRAGRLTVANCASCHGVHDILPSSDPRSHVNPANLPATCGQCHPGAGTTFNLGSVHGLTPSAAATAVGWIRLVYLWLIAITIGGMVAHNLLDFTGKVRHPPQPAPLVPASRERMWRSLRWQHGLVMMSFPVLVYSGFALTYPESWWATPLLRWEAGFGLRGLVHRTAAVLLLAALVWHLGEIALRPRLRACVRELMPSWRDAGALRRVLAASGGADVTRPPTGTFSYVEKVEYWAFLWGMLMMGATGFLLWFENVTLRFLPKWIADVATALHFYEAVLATLAIAVWHLYWVIFDPEVYPMDWTWWDGHAPAARVREREGEGEPRP
jgi:cytochrome b subunit of formate dehydrogenase